MNQAREVFESYNLFLMQDFTHLEQSSATSREQEDEELVIHPQADRDNVSKANHKPLLPLNISDFNNSLRIMGLSSISMIGSEMLYCISDFITMYYVGHMNDPVQIAAIGLGSVWSFAACLCFVFALDSGFSTLASQAFGAKNFNKLSDLFHLSVVLYLVILTPLCLALTFSENLFNLVGINSDVSREANNYIIWNIPGYICIVLFEVIATMLRAQNIFSIGVYTQIFTSFLTWFLCHLFQRVYNLGLIGFAMVKNINLFMNALILIIYVQMKNPCPQVWKAPWRNIKLIELWTYFKELLSLGGSRYLDMVSWEINLLIVSAYLLS